MHLLSESWHVALRIEIKKMTRGSLLSSLTRCVTQYFVYLWEKILFCSSAKIVREQRKHEEGEGQPSPPQSESAEKIKPGTQAAAD